MHSCTYDFLVIGAGSGGMAAARRAAAHLKNKSKPGSGARVALIERGGLGGTCVNVGCVPKKLLWNAANLADSLKLYAHYGFEAGHPGSEAPLAMHPLSSAVAGAKMAAVAAGAAASALLREPLEGGGAGSLPPKSLRDSLCSISSPPAPPPTMTDEQREILMSPSAGSSSGMVSFNWARSKRTRDSYIARLNANFENSLKKEGVELVRGKVSDISKENEIFRILVDVAGEEGADKRMELQAKNVLIATGAHSEWDTSVEGHEHGIDSDGFFALDEQPQRVGIVGSGYIATELAGIFNSLGSMVHMWIRGPRILRSFDHTVAMDLQEDMVQRGVFIQPLSHVRKVEKLSTGGKTLLRVQVQNDAGQIDTTEVDCLVWAIGRLPSAGGLGLEKFGGALDEATGFINVDQNDKVLGVDGMFALGDVVRGYHLTPVAIKVGRVLADRLFGGLPDSRVDLSNVPTVVFSHPPIGAVGLSEEDAVEKHGRDRVRVYSSKFTPMLYGMVPPGHRHRQSAHYKIVCETAGALPGDDRVLGIHIIGPSSDEIIQGFAVAISTGTLTKGALDRTIALHPTVAEELVTMR